MQSVEKEFISAKMKAQKILLYVPTVIITTTQTVISVKNLFHWTVLIVSKVSIIVKSVNMKKIERKLIHDYGYKPYPVFYGKGNRFFGVELEIDDGGKIYDNAKKILELANEVEENIYIKEDGSLSDGFEIVSYPMTLYYHKNNMNWQEIMKKRFVWDITVINQVQQDYISYVNRNCFGEYAEEQENAISRVLYFVEMFWNEMLCFSRRTEKQMKQWANRYDRKTLPKKRFIMQKGSRNGRYTCVNLNNYETIEFLII